ncbi:MAG: hypothetical protein JWM87_332 [Candidatus Eremiobacteraeota bacterium]|nr:hypothetical protein [Candidatus Eremiobacteraeota bacterium]
MNRPELRLPAFGVGLAIVIVALVIVIAAVVETSGENTRRSDELARLAQAGVAGAGAPSAPAATAAPAVRDVSAGCPTLRRPAGENGHGAIDMLVSQPGNARVDDGGRLNRGERHLLVGWALDPHGDRPLAGLCLVVDGRADARGTVSYGVPRPDVAAAYHRDDLAASGYTVIIPAGALSAGRHRLQVATKSADGAVQVLRPQWNVTAY